MCKDSHINQVSFTTHRHPTEYLRCDIHHVDDMQPQKAYSQTKTHPLPKSQKSNTPHRQGTRRKAKLKHTNNPNAPCPRTNLAHKPTLGINHLPGHPPTILGHQPRN